MAISVVMIFYALADITIERISILGNSIKVGNSAAVSIALWIVFGYWVYRYWLYFKEEPKLRFDYDYLRVLDGLCSPRIKKIAIRQNNQGLALEVLEEVLAERHFSMRKSGNFKKRPFFRAENWASRGGGIRPKNEKHPTLHVTARYFRFQFIHLQAAAFLKMAFLDSRFSDSYVPLAFAFMAVSAWGFRWISEVIRL